MISQVGVDTSKTLDTVISGTPHTFITFSADNTATVADNVAFTIRV